jgi:hypothetical protein
MMHDALAMTDTKNTILLEQWKHSVETLRYMGGLVVQTWSFLAAADSALLAFGFTNDRWELLVGAAVMPLLMLATSLAVGDLTVPVAFTAVATEAKLPGQPPAVLITTLLRSRAPAFLKKLESKLDTPCPELPVAALLRGKIVSVALVLGSVVQLTLAAKMAS